MTTKTQDGTKELTELEKLRIEREAFAKTREAKRTALNEAEALALEKRAFVEDQSLAAAQDEYGFDTVELVPSRLGGTIVKKPTQVLFRNFQEMGKLTANNLEKLVRPCLVYPTVPDWERIIKEQPAHLTDCADAVSRLAGADFKERQAK